MDVPDPTQPGGVIDDFKIMEQIGAGAFSRVHIAQHIPTGNYSAVKIINLAEMKEDEYKGMLREISVFNHVDHPNICHLYRISTWADKFLLLFMEYAPGGTLLELVNRKHCLSEGEAQYYFGQLFSAVRHLHVYHFLVHRDLKLENVLLSKGNKVKLTDFGLTGSYYNTLMHTFAGTPGYQAPEIIAGNEYTEKCDIWSLGVCLWAMVAGRLPFSTQNGSVRLFMQEVCALKYPSSFSAGLTDLLKRMLAPRPEDRPSLMQLQEHPWIRGIEKLGGNIAPHPVAFQIARHVAAIAKFRRSKVVAKPEILAKCEEMGIDVEKLKEDLVNGLTSPDTTTYFILCYPCKERAVVKVEQPKAEEPKPEVLMDIRPKRKDPVGMPLAQSRQDRLPPLNAKGRLPVQSTTNLLAPKPRQGLMTRLMVSKTRNMSTHRFEHVIDPTKRQSLPAQKR